MEARIEWNERVENLTLEELRKAFFHACGLLSTYPPFDLYHPEKVIEKVLSIQEDEQGR